LVVFSTHAKGNCEEVKIVEQHSHDGKERNREKEMIIYLTLQRFIE